MPNVTVKIDVRDALKRVDIAPDKVNKAIAIGMQKSAFLVERESKMSVNDFRAIDTGRMLNSISSDVYPMEATIAPHVDYAIFVHDGTRFVTPRPFMEKGLERAEESFQDIFENELEKYV